MTILNASVSRYSLTVDAADTIAVLVESAENPRGRRLQDALSFALQGQCVYPVGPNAAVSREDFRPDAPERPDMPNVEAPSASGVLDKLRAAGYVTVRDVWHETASQAYLSEGRMVTAVRVVRPFALVAVQYSRSAATNYRAIQHGGAYADQWEITEGSRTVPTGWYLVGEIGDYGVIELVGVAGMDTEHADWICWLAELEGFSASYCAAGCQSCGARWLAYGDSWHFDADECDADPWDFDDADEFDETKGTVACPTCDTGRVGFMIF